MAFEQIFSDTRSEFGGAMRANNVRITLRVDSGTLTTANADNIADTLQKSLAHLIVQTFDLRSNRPVTMLYDLLSDYVYFVSGRATTQVGLNRVAGPRGLITAFYKFYGNVCYARGNNILVTIPTGCDSDGNTIADMTFNSVDSKYLFVRHCVMTDVGFNINAQNFIISETSQMTGTDIEYIE